MGKSKRKFGRRDESNVGARKLLKHKEEIVT